MVMKSKPTTKSYTIYKLRTCMTLHQCAICGQDIVHGERYFDGGYGKRAHEKCVKDTDLNKPDAQEGM